MVEYKENTKRSSAVDPAELQRYISNLHSRFNQKIGDGVLNIDEVATSKLPKAINEEFVKTAHGIFLKYRQLQFYFYKKVDHFDAQMISLLTLDISDWINQHKYLNESVCIALQKKLHTLAGQFDQHDLHKAQTQQLFIELLISAEQ